MDKASWGGAVLGLTGIVGGLLLEGGNLSQVVQPTAAMIVFGGTMGAVLIQFPLPIVKKALRNLVQVFVEPKRDAEGMIRELVKFANKARRRRHCVSRRRLGQD
jgi:chemotaxis protein MotA